MSIPRWLAAGWWPFALVLVTLLSAIGVPLLSIRRTETLRDRISRVADPARARVADIQSAIAIESASTRWYAMTGARAAVESHDHARALGTQAMTQLGRFAHRLGPEVRAEHDSLAVLLATARATVDSLFSGQISRAEYRQRMPQRQERLQEVMRIARRFDRSIGTAASADVAEVDAIERDAAITTIALVALALIAAAVVAMLGRRHQQLSRQQVALLDQLRVAEESRARLLRGFTHDIKNPLGAADGYLALMQDGIRGTLQPEQTDSVRRVRTLIRSALNLIGQLLEIERADSGQLKIHVARLDLAATARDVADAYRPEAAAKGLTLSARFDSDVAVDSDPERVRQVIANLISNAVKYTPSGGHVEVEVGLESRRKDGTVRAPAVVSVKDDGPGIPVEQQAMLFHEFTRFNPGAAQGSGIGLAISQRIAQTLGGRITVDSAAGRGSTFRLWLPNRTPESGTAAPKGSRSTVTSL